MSREPERQDAVRAALAERGLDALLVSDLVNVRYLTGYVGSNALAVIASGGARLVTDSRYATSARAQVQGAEVQVGRRDLVADVAGALAELAPAGRIGVESDSLTLTRHARLAEALEGFDLVPVRGIVEDLRVRKAPEEIALIRVAAEMADTALARVLGDGLVGRTERDVAFAVLRALHEAGAEEPSFPPIVAAGPRGAMPHAVPGDVPIPPDTLVVIDQGAVHAGYCSDMTRTVPTGAVPEDLAEIYRVCRDAQTAALAAVRPGAECVAVDAAAREVIAAAGYGAHFGHGLGHGVGLEIHEGPRLSAESSGVLEAGMIVTIEPGIYLEGRGGVRHEELVVVTDDGCEVLSKSPKEAL